MAYLFLIGVYVILCLLHGMFARIYHVKERDCDKFFCVCFYAACAVIMGLRDLNVGVDTQNYSDIFRDVSEASWSMLRETHDDMELGYKFLMKFCAVLYCDYFLFQILVSFVFCGLSGYAVYKYGHSPMLISAVFLGSGGFLVAFNIARQMLAVALVVLGAFKLFERKYLSAIVMFLVAFSFHITSIVASLVIVSLYIFRNQDKLLKIAPVFILVLALLPTVLLSLFDYITDGSYAQYIANEKVIMTAGCSKILWLLSTLIALLILRKQKGETETQLIALLSLFYTVANIIGLSINYAERLGLFFLPFVCMCYGLFERQLKSKNLLTIYRFGTVTCFLLFFYISTLTPQYINYRIFI